LKFCDLYDGRKLVVGGYTSGFLVWGLFNCSTFDKLSIELSTSGDSDPSSLDLILISKGELLLDSSISSIAFYDFYNSVRYTDCSPEVSFLGFPSLLIGLSIGHLIMITLIEIAAIESDSFETAITIGNHVTLSRSQSQSSVNSIAVGLLTYACHDDIVSIYILLIRVEYYRSISFSFLLDNIRLLGMKME
jgi:hypothetical protein